MPQADHDYMDVFGPDCEDCGFEREFYTTGPVPGFVVDDVVAAREEMVTAGAELVGDIIWSKRNEGYGWFHFRAPETRSPSDGSSKGGGMDLCCRV
jgi:hypothetical protein